MFSNWSHPNRKVPSAHYEKNLQQSYNTTQIIEDFPIPRTSFHSRLCQLYHPPAINTPTEPDRMVQLLEFVLNGRRTVFPVCLQLSNHTRVVTSLEATRNRVSPRHCQRWYRTGHVSNKTSNRIKTDLVHRVTLHVS